jgi:putative flavoprotein involved in K+ transport
MTGLPGYPYRGDDPDGFMTAAQVVDLLEGYRRFVDPPVHTGVEVASVRCTSDGFALDSTAGPWTCRAVVVATGASSEPRRPALATELPASIEQLTALAYRRPEQLAADGRVLVVGASASGVQIADELRRAGREVTLAVGEHIRLPRSYRARDIYWWLDRIGQLDERYDEVEDLARARRHASIQVVGNDERRDLDLNALAAGGVQIVGRLMAIRGTTGQCSGALGSLVQNADLKQARLLRRIDEHVAEHSLEGAVGPASEPRPTAIGRPPTELDLQAYASVVWATGYRPTYPWLPAEALDPRGRLRHDGGVGAMPGLYVLGLPFLRRRRSNLLAGIGTDAADLFGHLRTHLDRSARPRPVAARVSPG